LITDEKPNVVYWLGSSLYLNITNKCSNRCWFCLRNFKQGVGGFNLKLKTEPTIAEVEAELEQVLSMRRWHEVVFTGFGEPTERLDVLLDIARWIKRRSGSSLVIRLDTNGHGYVLNKGRDVALELCAGGISKVSVSLNGHDSETYNENCRPTFEDAFGTVLDFIGKAKAAGLEVEISAVRLPEVNTEKIKAIAKALDVSFRLRDYIQCFW